MLRVANSCAWSRCFEASLEIPGLLRGAAPQRELRNRRALKALLGAGQDDLVEQLAAASERVFELTPEAVRQRPCWSGCWLTGLPAGSRRRRSTCRTGGTC